MPDAAPRRLRRWTFALLLGLLAATGGSADEPALPKANFTLVLEQTALRVRTSVPIHLLVENPSGVLLQSPTLTVRGPRGFTLREPPPGTSCTFQSAAGGDDDHQVTIGAQLPAHSLLQRELCLQVGNVAEADLNLLFVLSFRLPVAGGWAASASTSTQPVQVGLLGTETIGGTSLRLVTFFLPGVILLFMLRLFRVPVVGDLNSTEQGFAAIGVSAVLAALAEAIGPGLRGEHSSSLSLVILCGLGMGLGVALGIFWRLYVWLERLRIEGLVVQKDDTDETIRRKLFAAAKEHNVLIRLKDGIELIGSCSVEAWNGYVLGSWYEVAAPADQHLLQILKENSKAGNWQCMLRSAEQAHLDVTIRNFVLKRAPGQGQLVPLSATVVHLRTEELDEVKPTREGSPDGPLSLA